MELKGMSLRQKIGQMVMCGFPGPETDANIEKLIKEHHLGGVIFFRKNMKNPKQVAELSAKLQSFAAEKGDDLPLLVSIDQEGGMVTRIEEGIALMPGNMSIGATRDADAAYDTAAISGRELRAMGINVNFAPDVDVNNNPLNPVIGVRSYGEDPQLVADLGIAAVRGYEASGVAATIKHFPGHGDTAADSHYDLPVVPHDLDRLQSVELVPFKQAIQEGVDLVMSAHVIFPALEQGGLPSTLSSKVMDGFLRKELGFEGVISTDCMEMKAIADHYGVDKGAVMAVEAGVDLVLVSHTYAHQITALEALYEAVESGRISEARIDESVERILKLKRKLKEANKVPVSLDELGLPASVETAERVFEKSVTLVKNDGQLPFAAGKKTLVVWTEVRLNTEVSEVIEQVETLGYFLKQSLGQADEVRIGQHPTDEEIGKVLELSAAYDQVAFVTYSATFSEGQTRVAAELAERAGKFVVVAGRNPFDLIRFPQVKAFIAAYENRPLAMKAVAKIVAGELKAQGRLPVSINEEYKYGWSLS